MTASNGNPKLVQHWNVEIVDDGNELVDGRAWGAFLETNDRNVRDADRLSFWPLSPERTSVVPPRGISPSILFSPYLLESA